MVVNFLVGGWGYFGFLENLGVSRHSSSLTENLKPQGQMLKA